MSTLEVPPPVMPASNGARATEAAAPATASTGTWGNSGPLALLGFATTTFMLSMINANLINAKIEPAVFAVALMFGGGAQLIAGLIQLRNNNTFTGVLFSTYGAFWLCLFALAKWFLADIPAAQAGHALGLFLYAFGLVTIVMWLVSFRTNVVVVGTLAVLGVTFFVLAAGNYGAHSGLVHLGGFLGLAAAAGATYLAIAELCEASYGRTVLPLGSLSR